MALTVGVADETRDGERRVAASPASVRALVAAEHARRRAGRGRGRRRAGPTRSTPPPGRRSPASTAEVLEQASMLLCVRGSGPGAGTWDGAGSSHMLAGLFDPLGEPAAMQRLAESGATVFAIDLLPRITRAQPMDVLSSQATVAGYKAVIVAASLSPRLFPMLTYAAGTIPPAKVLVLGAGVAGLQAIATARRLGANVSAYDVRAAVREQIESLGARFVDLADVAAGGEDASGYATGADEAELARQQAALAAEIGGSDVVITTALVPGQRSPILVTAAAIEAMKPGSVIVDLAAERGGNCEGTVAGKTVEIGGVTLVGAENLPATVPQDASQMLARNLANFVLHIAKDGEVEPRQRRPHRPGHPGGPWREGRARARRRADPAAAAAQRGRRVNIETGLYVFLLASFLGFELIRRVPQLLHTPADVAHQRHLRHRAGRVDRHRGQLAVGHHHGARDSRDRGLVLQRDRRLPAHRPDAAHVQEAQLMRENVVQYMYLAAGLSFIFAIKWMTAPHHRAARRASPARWAWCSPWWAPSCAPR